MKRTLLAALLALLLPLTAGAETKIINMPPAPGAVFPSPVLQSPTITGPVTLTATFAANTVVNGTFDADASWSKGAGWTISGGAAVATNATQNLEETTTTVVANNFYRLTHTSTVASGSYRIVVGSWVSQTYSASQTAKADYFYVPYQAAATTPVRFAGVTSFTGTIDNVTLEVASTTFACAGTNCGLMLASSGDGAVNVYPGSGPMRVYQGSDGNGIQIRGYDDRALGYLSLSVASTGVSTITAEGGSINIVPPNTGDLNITVDADSIVQIGDNSYSWDHTPHVGIEGVTEFDSKAWFDAGLNVTGTVTATDGLVIGETLGPELASLDATCTGWSFTGNFSCVAGALVKATGATGTATSAVAVDPGERYKVVWSVTFTTASSGIRLGAGSWAGEYRTASGTYTDYLIPGDAITDIRFITISSTVAGSVTAVSIKKVTSTITSGGGPIAFYKEFADNTASQVGVSIVGEQTGTGGAKTALRVESIGSGTGAEFVQEWYADGSRVGSITNLGQITANSDIVSTTTNKTVGTNSSNFTVQTHSGSFTGGGAMPSGAVQLVTGTNSRTAGAQVHASVSPTYNQTSGTAANTELLVSRTSTDVGTGTQTGIDVAFNMETGATNSNTGVSGLAYPINIAGTIAPMDGSDTWNGINIAPTNADHTGSSNAVNAINIASISGDAQSVESAIMVGAGYDYTINGTSSVNFNSSRTTGTPYNFYHAGDTTQTPIFNFAQVSSTSELTSTDSVQSFVLIKPEIANSGTAGYTALDVFVGDGGTGTGEEYLIKAQVGGADFATPATKFTVSSTGAVTQNTTVKTLAFSKTNLTNNSAVDIFTITLADGEYIGGRFDYELSSTGGSSDIQVHSGEISFVCANKGGTFTSDIDEVYLAASETTVLTAGTFADTWAMKAGNVCTVTLNINSNLSSAVNTVRGEITLMQAKTITLD